MGFDNISLQSNVRANLIALQSIDKSLSRTEERLATGKKVNNIIDNPTNFFASRTFNDRADALNQRLDGLSNAIQTINAANAGIDAIRSLLANAKALVNDALSKGNADSRRELGEQYNEVIEQAFGIASDSNFNGVNLLANNQRLNVEFGEANDQSTLKLKGLDIQGAGGNGVSSITKSATETRASVASGGSVASLASISGLASVASAASAGSTQSIASVASSASVASNATIASVGSVSTSAGGASAGSIASSASVTSVASSASVASAASGGSTSSIAQRSSVASRTSTASGGSTASVSISFTQRFAFSLQVDPNDPSETIGLRKATDQAGFRADNGDHRVDFGADNFISALNALTKEIDNLDEALNTQASRLATNLNIVQVRQSFTEDLTNILSEGADQLVLADTNEEGANLLALQTRQALAIQSLSISSQQSQQVLNLLT